MPRAAGERNSLIDDHKLPASSATTRLRQLEDGSPSGLSDAANDLTRPAHSDFKPKTGTMASEAHQRNLIRDMSSEHDDGEAIYSGKGRKRRRLQSAQNISPADGMLGDTDHRRSSDPDTIPTSIVAEGSGTARLAPLLKRKGRRLASVAREMAERHAPVVEWDESVSDVGSRAAKKTKKVSRESAIAIPTLPLFARSRSCSSDKSDAAPCAIRGLTDESSSVGMPPTIASRSQEDVPGYGTGHALPATISRTDLQPSTDHAIYADLHSSADKGEVGGDESRKRMATKRDGRQSRTEAAGGGRDACVVATGNANSTVDDRPLDPSGRPRWAVNVRGNFLTPLSHPTPLVNVFTHDMIDADKLCIRSNKQLAFWSEDVLSQLAEHSSVSAANDIMNQFDRVTVIDLSAFPTYKTCLLLGKLADQLCDDKKPLFQNVQRMRFSFAARNGIICQVNHENARRLNRFAKLFAQLSHPTTICFDVGIDSVAVATFFRHFDAVTKSISSINVHTSLHGPSILVPGVEHRVNFHADTLRASQFTFRMVPDIYGGSEYDSVNELYKETYPSSNGALTKTENMLRNEVTKATVERNVAEYWLSGIKDLATINKASVKGAKVRLSLPPVQWPLGAGGRVDEKGEASFVDELWWKIRAPARQRGVQEIVYEEREGSMRCVGCGWEE